MDTTKTAPNRLSEFADPKFTNTDSTSDSESAATPASHICVVGQDGQISAHRSSLPRKPAPPPADRSEQEYRHLFETAPIPYVLIEQDATVVRANETFRREFFFPVTTDGSKTNLWQKLVPQTEAFSQAAKAWRERALRMRYTGMPVEPFEETVSRYDGETRSVVVSCVLLAGRQKGRLLVALQDITERKNSERQIAELSQRLLGIAELERAWVARELHETIGQELAALKLALQRSADAAILEAGGKIDALLASLRLMSGTLHPPVLEALGLEAALGDLFEKVSAYREIRFVPEFAPPPALLSPSEEIGLYRIVEQCVYALPAAVAKADFWVKLQISAAGTEMHVRIEGEGIHQMTGQLDEVLLRQRAYSFQGSLTSRFSENRVEISVKTRKNNHPD